MPTIPRTDLMIHHGGCHCRRVRFQVINARCLDGVDLQRVNVTPFDDGNRDGAMAAIAHITRA